MDITNIRYVNIKTLYDMHYEHINNDEYKNNKFGKKELDLFNHVGISMDLTLSLYEFMILKLFMMRDKRLMIFDLMLDRDNMKINYPELTEKNNAIDQLIDIIIENNLFNEMSSVLPVGLLIGKTHVVFSGADLATLLSLDLESIFLNKNEKDYNPEKDEEFKNKVMDSFFKKFYHIMLTECTSIDLLSDYMNDSYILKNVSRENSVNVINIKNPFFMYNNLSDKESLNNIYAEYMKIDSDLRNDYILNDTQMEIAICTNFGVFCKLMQFIEGKNITSIQPLSIPQSIDISSISIPEPSNSNIYHRWYGRIKEMIEILNSVYGKENPKNILKSYEMTLPFTEFKFILSLSFDDITTRISPIMEDKSNNEKMYGKDTIKLLEKIFSSYQIFYKLLHR